MKIYKCFWYDDNPDATDDNQGLIYGVKWFDKNDNFLDIEWYSNRKDRNEEYKRLKALKELSEMEW